MLKNMSSRLALRSALALLLTAACVLSGCASQAGATPATVAGALPAHLDSDARGVVSSIRTLSNRYWHRVAGGDAGLPPHLNGHDEFAAAWTGTIRSELHGLPTTVFHDTFLTHGFSAVAATRPGDNVVVAVAGAIHPERAILLCAHYDGEPDSHGSAYDDTSGSALLLGVAGALGDAWRTHGLPAETIEFVIFDGEEEGLLGSAAMAAQLRHGAPMPRVDLLIDEEQSGMAYPVRPFGLRSRALIPSFAITSEPIAPQIASALALTPQIQPPPAALATLVARVRAARTAAFPALHAVYPSISYRGGEAPAFTPFDEARLAVGPLPHPGLSDNAPFDAMGVPSVTFSGDENFYSKGAPDWSYPFDQPEDTFATLACLTGGSPASGPALRAALAVPLALSVSLVNAYSPPSKGHGITLLSDLAGAEVTTHLAAAGPGPLHWTFGDGGEASGRAVTHTYEHPGTYTVTVRGNGSVATHALKVADVVPTFASPIHVNAPHVVPWHPKELATIAGCH
jgi:hypothetical protein